ncbi:MAG: hypothetical protein DSY33_05615 [Archaeoglobus sp.]|nr:MAG: hypothetical protein DSY33_05615 [Archaeoglobus sp.]
MDFAIKKLGPINEAKLELGDITVLIGPPNVGKSYTLKALYSSLLMLDPIARKSLLKSIFAELRVLKHRRFLYEESIFIFLTNLAILYKIDPQMTKYIAKRIGDVVGKIDIKIENDTIVATSKRAEILDLKKLVELIQEQNAHLWGVVPTADKTKVNLKLPIPNLFSILVEAFRKPLVVKEENYNQELKLFVGCYISSYLQETKLILERTAEIKLDTVSPIIKKRYPKGELLKLEKAKDTAEILEILYNLRLFKLTPKDWIILLRAIPEMVLTEEIQDRLAEKIGKMLESIYRRGLGIQSVLFIPFGRSPIVCQLEYISREPFLRTEIIEDYYELDIPLYPYMSKLSSGRAKLSESTYEKEIVQLFEPVFQGNLIFDKRSGELKYKRWSFKGIDDRYSVIVPIKWASALAGEVTGILLPILSVPYNSYLIIEEPESQLHYSAQVLMALTLIGLSNVFGHKIAFSTHSDVLTLTLAYIQEFKPNENKVLELIKKLLEMQNVYVDEDNLRPLAKAVSEAENIDIRFYYYEPTPSGVKVSERSSLDVLRDVPGITDVVNILATWAMSL